jgi:hypothetical protein
LGYTHKECGRQGKRRYQHVQTGHVLIIDDAPRASEVAKKHDKKDGYQGFSDHQRHKLA